VICLNKKKSTALAQKRSWIAPLENSSSGSLVSFNSDLKGKALSTDLLDFSAHLIGSAEPQKYDVDVYNKKTRVLATKADFR